MIRLTFSPIFGSIFVVIFIAMAVIIIVGLVRPRREGLSAKQRNCLILLRIFVVFLVVFAMLRPTIVYQESEPLAATLVLLIDQSESMSIPDEAGGQTRYEVLKAALEKARSALAKLEKRYEIQVFAFDRQIEPLKMEDGKIEIPEYATAKETAIGASLQQILERNAGKRLLGTILLSDGTQKARPPYDLLPQTVATRFRDSGDVISTVRLGSSAGLANREEIAIQEMIANDRVFIKNELLISGNVRVNGFANRKIPIGLFYETASGIMSEVARTEIAVTEPGKILPFQFRYSPQTPGQWKMTVAVIPPQGTPLEQNQSLSRFVRVLDHGVNVFYIEGTWREESKFLRESLDASPDIQVTYYRRSAGDQRPLDDFLKPGEYAAYILGDISVSRFRSGELDALTEAVRRGSGLLMLGGSQTFGAGGYAETPLEAVSPIVIDTFEQRGSGISGEIQMLPSQRGGRHYLMRLTPDLAENERQWKSLPMLNGANLFGRSKPMAEILAETPNHEPLLVTHLFGEGRVIAFAADSTWRWWMRGHSQEHKRFWRQVVLWLTKMDETLDGDCWIEMEKNRFFPGEVVTFKIHVQSKTGEELLSPKATAIVQNTVGEEKTVVLVDENGVMKGSFRATETPGDYLIRATAEIPESEDSEAELRETSGRFMVVDQNLELENPIASPTVLENIATTTGGTSITPESLPMLLNELTKQASELVEYHETKRTLYDTWTFFAVFVAAIALEWFLRKRWGLV